VELNEQLDSVSMEVEWYKYMRKVLGNRKWEV